MILALIAGVFAVPYKKHGGGGWGGGHGGYRGGHGGYRGGHGGYKGGHGGGWKHKG